VSAGSVGAGTCEVCGKQRTPGRYLYSGHSSAKAYRECYAIWKAALASTSWAQNP
jgi:hypothetical protein